MSHYESNLELIRKWSEPLAIRMESYHEQLGEPTTIGGFALEPSRSGLPTVKFTGGEQAFYVHSPYDPQHEAEQYAAQLMEKATDGNFAVFFGMGLGYGAHELCKHLPESTRILVFEPHWQLFYLAFLHTDLEWLLDRPNSTLSCDPSVQGALMQYMNLFELAGFTGVQLFSNPAFERLPAAEHFNELADRIRYEMLAVGGNVQTLMVMGEMQQMNIILNFPHILDNPPFSRLLGQFQGKPAVIVSAGPSLGKNMHLLPEIMDRALIIAVDTSIKPLLAAGIKPHVVVTGDPQEANSRHLRGVETPETYLIAEPQSPIASLNGWQGPKFICTFHDNMMQWVDRVLGNRGRVLVWGSVAVMAYDVAVKIGADPIVFIGQDLSFPEGRTYTKGTFFETEDKQEMTVEELKKSGTSMIDMTDIYGQPIETNRQMYSYFNFLKNRFNATEVKERTIINATEGGILKSPKVKILSLRETIDQYMGEPLDVRSILDEAHLAGNAINYANLLIELDTLVSHLRESQEMCQRGVDAVEKTLKMIEVLDESPESEGAKHDAIVAYNRVVAIRQQIVRSQETNKIIEMANQAGIYSFAKGVKNTKLEDHEDDRFGFIKRACYHYHTLYLSSLEAIERLIPPIEAARRAARERSGIKEPVATG